MAQETRQDHSLMWQTRRSHRKTVHPIDLSDPTSKTST